MDRALGERGGRRTETRSPVGRLVKGRGLPVVQVDVPFDRVFRKSSGRFQDLLYLKSLIPGRVSHRPDEAFWK